MDDYDRDSASKYNDRPDFLAWLRDEESKGKPMSNRDMVNHLSNNLWVFPVFPAFPSNYGLAC